MDVRLKGGMDGIHAAELIRRQLSVPIVYLTAHSDQGTLQRIKASGASGYIQKPSTSATSSSRSTWPSIASRWSGNWRRVC